MIQSFKWWLIHIKLKQMRDSPHSDPKMNLRKS